MAAASILLPVLALIAGVASLFVDRTSSLRRGVATGLVMILVAACVVAVAASSRQASETKTSLQTIAALRVTMDSLRQENSQYHERLFAKLEEWGFVADVASPQMLGAAVAAERERARLVAATSPETRRGIGVRYYAKNVDREKVEAALRDLGFTLQRGTPSLPGMPTNAVFFGSRVPVEAVKLVAYTLMRAGVQITTIRPFVTPGLKEDLIEVGSYRDAADALPLTPNDIASATQFPLLKRTPGA